VLAAVMPVVGCRLGRLPSGGGVVRRQRWCRGSVAGPPLGRGAEV